MSVADAAIEGMVRDMTPFMTRDLFYEWLLSMGIDPINTREIKFTVRSIHHSDAEEAAEVYLEVTQYHLIEGRPWVDRQGNIATETVFVPCKEFGHA